MNIEDYLKAFCEKKQFCIEDVLGRSRRADIFKQRTACAKFLRNKGFSYPEIGRTLNRAHNTIMAMVNR